jgi:hypothetical protein
MILATGEKITQDSCYSINDLLKQTTNLVSAMQSDSFDQAPGRVIYKEIHDLLGSSRVFLLYLVFLTNAHMCSLILQPVRLTGG